MPQGRGSSSSMPFFARLVCVVLAITFSHLVLRFNPPGVSLSDVGAVCTVRTPLITRGRAQTMLPTRPCSPAELSTVSIEETWATEQEMHFRLRFTGCPMPGLDLRGELAGQTARIALWAEGKMEDSGSGVYSLAFALLQSPLAATLRLHVLAQGYGAWAVFVAGECAFRLGGVTHAQPPPAWAGLDTPLEVWNGTLPARTCAPPPLPVCTGEQAAEGRWLLRTRTEPLWVSDILQWQPWTCELRYFTADEVLARLAHKTMLIIGDSQLRGFYYELVSFLQKVDPNPRGVHMFPMDFIHDESVGAFNVTYREAYGFFDDIIATPVNCSQRVVEPEYYRLQRINSHGLPVLRQALTYGCPDFVVWGEGIHLFNGGRATEEDIAASVTSVFELLLPCKGRSRVIYRAMLPSAYIPAPVWYRGWRRIASLNEVAISIARSHGARIYNPYPLGVSRPDRYFDETHIFPTTWYGTPWNAFPRLLSNELLAVFLPHIMDQ